MSARDGKRWNNERREWVVENLEDEAASLPADDEDILSAARERTRCNDGARSPPCRVRALPLTRVHHAAGAASAARSGGAGPAETGYYEALGVPHTATQAEIKRSYYLLARQLVRSTRPWCLVHAQC